MWLRRIPDHPKSGVLTWVGLRRFVVPELEAHVCLWKYERLLLDALVGEELHLALTVVITFEICNST